MATCAPRKEEVSLEVEAVPLETRTPLGTTPLGSVETPSGAAVSEIPTASATLSPYDNATGMTAVPVHATRATWRPHAYAPVPNTYVGVPVEREERPATDGGARLVDSRIGDFRGDITLGVEGDLDSAGACARESARKDNDSFGARFAERHAQIRVEEEARELEVARFNAKRADAQGLDMRPHPGNRLEPPKQQGGLYGEKAFAFEGGSGGDKSKAKEAGAGATEGGKGQGGGGGDSIFASGGYQPAEYQPMDYDCTEYKSVYETTTKK